MCIMWNKCQKIKFFDDLRSSSVRPVFSTFPHMLENLGVLMFMTITETIQKRMNEAFGIRASLKLKVNVLQSSLNTGTSRTKRTVVHSFTR